jgi:uncharacterized repeat protein (TIGR03803 family)
MASMTHKARLLLLILTLAATASAEWNEKVLYSFQGGTTDGSSPAGGVVFDAAGNLYGATDQGGGECPPAQCGTVFQLSPPAKSGDPWTETVLHVFNGNATGDGNTPVGSVIIDSSGNLYGTTAYGGTGNCVLFEKVGCGTVYELSPPAKKGGAWTETILYSFPTAKQGYFPNGNLVFDKAGNLYGATMFGGGYGTSCNAFYQYCGAVFELNPPKKKGGKWTEKVLHGFKGMEAAALIGDGANPNGGLVLDDTGAIYGTTYRGGYNCAHNSGQGCGTAFKLTPPTTEGGAWTETVLYRFSPDSGLPLAGFVMDAKGNLYGTTQGTTFRLAPPSTKSERWKEMILYTFGILASDPGASLTFDARGNLCGTTESGFSSSGTVFRLKPNQTEPQWTLSVIHGFLGTPDGSQPAANLIFDKHGNLYSTTQTGGTGTCSFYGCGTVFEVSP